MLKQASTACRAATRCAAPCAHIAELDAVRDVADIDAGAVEPNAHARAVAIELLVVERRQHDVVHGAAGRDAGDQRAHQKPRQRGVAVGKMIDVGLVPLRAVDRRKPKPAETRIAGVAGVRRRHRVAAEPRRNRACGPGSSSPPPRCSRAPWSDSRGSSCVRAARSSPPRSCRRADRRCSRTARCNCALLCADIGNSATNSRSGRALLSCPAEIVVHHPASGRR